ncbi:MAG TPA: PilZ domain-containing protein [Gemmataceae bacterium]|nr:PilZ domain-containing protein [Gemmataceae bacterium]
MSIASHPAQRCVEQIAVDEAERRGAERFLCSRECVVRPEDATGVGNWSGLVYNISETGMGIVLPYAVLPGKTLFVEPWGRSKARGVHVRVIRSVPRTFIFFHGCELAEHLTREEIQNWLN